jgi:hypothetical protein
MQYNRERVEKNVINSTISPMAITHRYKNTFGCCVPTRAQHQSSSNDLAVPSLLTVLDTRPKAFASETHKIDFLKNAFNLIKEEKQRKKGSRRMSKLII